MMTSQRQQRASSSKITDAWYEGAIWLYILAPLSIIYAVLIFLRGWFYRLGILSSYRSSLPVIIVGNITVGGTGKSPLVAYLVQELQARGYRPGVVSRGYGANISKSECREVLVSSLPSEVGDEPLMLKQKLTCPIFVSPNRKLSVQALESQGCDVVISDDGLQHYALQRDVEICVFDGKRGLGNGYLLPMGPMREPASRVKRIDLKVVNGSEEIIGSVSSQDVIRMDLVPRMLEPLFSGESLSEAVPSQCLSELSEVEVNAVAAIGNPERFFEVLERNGMIVNRYAFEDHHAYSVSDFDFKGDLPLIMTEKDAVKCRTLGLKNAWYLPVEASLSHNLVDMLTKKL